MSEKITMEIINSEKYHRANIRFSGIPSEEVRTAMKKEGWTFSHANKVWYPTNSAADNSLNFAKKLEETYFPKQNTEQNELAGHTEQSDAHKFESIISGSKSLTEIMTKLSETFGASTLEKALTELKRSQNMENMAFREKSTGKFFTIQKSDEYGYDWTLFDKDYNEIDGENYFSVYSENFNRADYKKTMLEFAKDTLHDYGINYDDCEDADFDEVFSRSFDAMIEEAEKARKEIELNEKYEREEQEFDDATEQEDFDSDYEDYENQDEENFQTLASENKELSNKQTERLIADNIYRIFSDLTPTPFISEIKFYHPEEYGFGQDGKIHILLQYEGNWREDDLFNVLAEKGITFQNQQVDVNPITPSQSGTIKSYLAHLKEHHERNLRDQKEPEIENKLSEYKFETNENPDLLSWLDMEERFSTKQITETRNGVLESYKETERNYTEKEIKEECVARLLENQIEFYGFDTGKSDSHLNSEISITKWNILEKLAEKVVSKELDLKPYTLIQDEADNLLKENHVFRKCIENGILSAPDLITKADILSDKINEIKKEIQKEDAGYDFDFTTGKNSSAPMMRIYKDGNLVESIINHGTFTTVESNPLPDKRIILPSPEINHKLEHISRINDEIIKEKHKEIERLKADAKIQKLGNSNAILYEYKKYASQICHLVKDNGDPEAVQITAEFLAEQINEDCVLIPVPQHSGKAEYTALIAQKIAEIKGASANIEVADILETTPHKPLYEQKKEITEREKRLLTEEDIKNLDTGKLSLNDNYKNFEETIQHKKVYIIDNVIETGSTIKAVQKFFPNAEPLVFAVSKSYKERDFYNPLRQTQKHDSVNEEESFISDREKMADFLLISKEEFLASYSYISEGEYEATRNLFEKNGKQKPAIANISLEAIFNAKLSENGFPTDTVRLSNGDRIERDGDKIHFDLYNGVTNSVSAMDGERVERIAKIKGISYFKNENGENVVIFSLDEKECKEGVTFYKENPVNTKDIAEKYYEISEKLSNSYLTDEEKSIVEQYEQDEASKNQVERSVRSTKFFLQYYDESTGYFEPKNQKKITAHQARKLLGNNDFISGLDRASFHWTSFRNIDSRTGVYFDDNPKNKNTIAPYILTDEDKKIIFEYENTNPKLKITKESLAESSLNEAEKTRLFEMIKNSGKKPLFTYSEKNHKAEDIFIISNSGNSFDLQYYNLNLNVLSTEIKFETMGKAEENAIKQIQKHSSFFNSHLSEYEFSDLTQAEQNNQGENQKTTQNHTEEQIEKLAVRLGLSPQNTPADDISSTVTDGKITISASIELTEDLGEESDLVFLKAWENESGRTIRETSFDVSSESGRAHAYDIVNAIAGTAAELNIPLETLKESSSHEKAENAVRNKIEYNKEIQLTPEDIEIARTMIPKAQYELTLELTQGEEGDFFKQKIKDTANIYRKIRTNKEIINDDGTHPLGFRYFLGDTEIYISEIYADGTTFGYTILNGDLEMSEWGESNLQEITEIPGMEMDYHVPRNITIEEMLYEKHPDYFENPERMQEKEHNIETSPAQLETFETDKDENSPESDVPHASSFKEECIENFISLLHDLAYKDSENQNDFLSDKNATTGRTYEEICKDYLTKLKNGEKILSEANENSIGEAIFFNENFEELKAILEIDDTYGSLAGFLENREKPLESFLNEDEYYAQPIAADILNDELNRLDSELQNQLRAYQPEKKASLSDIQKIREKCHEILKKSDDEITSEEKAMLAQYEGAGGTREKDRTASGILHEFYTPNNVIEKAWKIADTYAPNAKTVLEPSSGIGKFAKNRPDNVFTMRELDETSARIAKILHPEATVIQGAFQKQFFDENERAVNKDYKIPTYDIVIGNPPYGKYNDKFKGLGEGKEFETYEEYFLSRGLDSLKDENSLLVFVMPSGFLNNSNDKQKAIIAAKGNLVDAYRLPEKVFPTTEVGTDIVVFKKGSCDPAYISNGTFFNLNPQNILGEKANRINRFGKAEEFVKLPEGTTIQDELNKIDSLAEENAKTLKTPEEITFSSDKEIVNKLESVSGLLKNNVETVRAIQIAVAGRHNILVSGAKESGMSKIIESLIPAITPNLTVEQAKLNENIISISYQSNQAEKADYAKSPFRKPKQNSPLEKICGGGINCTPGEISLANNGTLFLDDATEFRNSILQTLRIPLEKQEIMLSRTGKSVVYPADFQLALTAAPCPCGNNHVPGKVCLCSENSKKEYWEKINAPLLEKIEIRQFAQKDENNGQTVSIQDLQSRIAKAYKIQRKHGVFNHSLSPSQLAEFCKLNNECQKYVDEIHLNESEKKNLLKVTLTVANMDGREEIQLNDLKEANELCSPLFEKPNLFKYEPTKTKEEKVSEEKIVQKEIGNKTNSNPLAKKRKKAESFQPELFPVEEKKQDDIEAYTNRFQYVPTPQEAETAAQILKEAKRLPENIYNNIAWLVNIHRCYNERVIPVVVRLYDTFSPVEAFERSKVVPRAFGDGHSDAPWCDEEKLSTVIGIYDKNLHYHTVWDRSFAAHNKMPEEKIKDLIEYDYSGKNHIFRENSAAEKNYAVSPTADTMNVQEFTKYYKKAFNESDFRIWRTTDWEGYVNTTKLSDADRHYLKTCGNYIEETPGKWTHRVLFESGDIYKKIEKQKSLLKYSESEFGANTPSTLLHKRNIAILQSIRTAQIALDDIHISVNSTIAEEFMVTHQAAGGEMQDLNLAESFILWAKGEALDMGEKYIRRHIDFATANISKDELPENVDWRDIVDFIDGVKIMADRTSSWSFSKTDEEIRQLRHERKKEADLKRMARADTANRLFDRYLHEGLDKDTEERLCKEYNRRFNSYVTPKYENLPLYIDGMSRKKGPSPFKLYDQQLKGASRLCIKGNGVLAYDVGVGKTATGIVANANQIQTGRSSRPLIIVPNSVYPKWVNDIHQLFPKIKVNELYNFGNDSIDKFRSKEEGHVLDIEPNSISVCTYEALKRITFTDESCKTTLFEEFAKLVSADFDGTEKENAAAIQKINDAVGSSSAVDDPGYVFFEKCGFDNITVDEAHNFKNLWVVPRPKNKNGSNEYSGIPSGTPSKRALKLYAMTQIIQKENDNRNVYLLTATPFTNSPLEVYSMLSYVGRQRLIDSGIYSLRDFLNQFAHTKLELAVNPKGEIEYRQVMKDWKELPALQNLLMEFIDKVDGEEAGIIRPKKFTHLKELDLSPLQKEIMTEEEIRMTETKKDNPGAVLEAMNNMRLALVSPALLKQYKYSRAEIPELSQFVETSPKLKFVCDAVIDMYKTNRTKGQFMYIPLGKEGHLLVKDYLISHGVPKEAIQIINGEINGTSEKKDKITAAFNDLENPLKIIIGGKNTSEGIDLNGNSFVMYNCSLGWNPSETVQAEGRIWRQGNIQGHVHIVYPVMNDSIDSLLYQKHDEKRSRINDLWTYKGNTLNVEDINPEELKFDLIKNPEKRVKLILDEQTKDLNNQLSRVNLKIENFDEIIEKRINLIKQIKDTEEKIQHYKKESNNYIAAGEELPDFIKEITREAKKDAETFQKQQETVNKKLEKLNIHSEEEINQHLHSLNQKKQLIEAEIKAQKEKIPAMVKEMKLRLAEQKLTAHPIEQQRKELEEEILSNLRPMSEILEEMKQKKQQMLQNDASLKDKNYASLFSKDDLKAPENLAMHESQPVYYAIADDTTITEKEVKEAEFRRNEITEPILKEKKEGLWTAFKTFQEKGVFDIVGQIVPLTDSNTLDETALIQLKSAMEIYRDKKFETFRYVLIDRKTGEIDDQLSVSINMPTTCIIDYENKSLLKSVISRAEEKDCLVAVAHNHPSGNPYPSLEDIYCTESLQNFFHRADGLNRFAGHIILDHDSFSLYTPKTGWQYLNTNNQTNDKLLKENLPDWLNTSIENDIGLVKIAESLNDKDSWNDKHIPVIFVNSDSKISGIKFYYKNFFYAPPENVKNELMFTAINSAAIGAFPIMTEHFSEKLSLTEQTKFEKSMKRLIEKNCIVDCGTPSVSLSEKFKINPGAFYTDEFQNMEKLLKINTTWKTQINPALFKEQEESPQNKRQIAEIER